jgi:2-octaprenyl-6-methoxyphenol hydroxylase
MLFDVVIVGGGIVGASFACSIADTGLQIAIIDGRAGVINGALAYDGRASAISYRSVQVWQSIGVWSAMLAKGVTPMHTVQITDQDYDTKVELHHRDMDTPFLGYVVENAVSHPVLWAKIRQCPAITPILGQVRATYDRGDRVEVVVEGLDTPIYAKLLVGADGAKSTVRQLANIPSTHKTYAQSCLVLTVRATNSHDHTAYEKFRHGGPFAVLPITDNRFCIVWTADKNDTPRLLALPEEEFMQELKSNMGAELVQKLGVISLVSPPTAYTPQWQHSHHYYRHRTVLIGDSAHTTHPIGGQGLNLGIRDVSALRQAIKQALSAKQDIGAPTVLQTYARQRYWENLLTILVTDATNQIFSNDVWLWQGLRHLGLDVLKTVHPLRQLLMYLGMGLHSPAPF